MKWSPEKYTRALDYAEFVHRGQTRLTSEQPYVIHLVVTAMEVMRAVGENGSFRYPDLAIQAALLHDTLEDTESTYDELLAWFGKDVADGVKALTLDTMLLKQAQMPDSLGRIRLQPREIWLVKMADRLSNLTAPPMNWSIDKRKQYWRQSKDIRDNLKSADDYLAARLLRKIGDYETYFDGRVVND